MFTPHNMSHVTCHMSHVTCHVSCVTCHMSHVTCHISHVMCHMPNFFPSYFFGQFGEAYQRLVFRNISVSHTKNVGQSQSNMQPFFLYIQVINNMSLLFPTVGLVMIENPSNFQGFICVLKCI